MPLRLEIWRHLDKKGAGETMGGFERGYAEFVARLGGGCG
jgi:hypothetical protein